jgi:hypothetical protein
MENMARIKAFELQLDDLKRHPVWTWSSELDQPEDSLVPVELTEDALAEADSLLVVAKFTTAAGNEHDGLVVYDADLDEVFAVELFFQNDRITMNSRVPEISSMLDRYEIATGLDKKGLLPLRYKIDSPLLNIAPGSFKY